MAISMASIIIMANETIMKWRNGSVMASINEK
jgi:hypothetical protein